jgi:PAS domain-containing protein
MVELVNSNWDEFIENLLSLEIIKDYFPEIIEQYNVLIDKYKSEEDLVANFPFPALITNLDGDIHQANKEALSFFQIKSKESIISKKITEFGFPFDLENFEFFERKYLLTKAKFSSLNFPKNIEQKKKYENLKKKR